MVHDDQTARSSYLTTDSTGMLKTAVADDDSTSLPNGHALPQSHDASATPAQERGSEGPATMDEKGPVVVESAEFKPDWMFYAAFSSLSIVTLMVALDATSISVALPVSGISLPLVVSPLALFPIRPASQMAVARATYELPKC